MLLTAVAAMAFGAKAFYSCELSSHTYIHNAIGDESASDSVIQGGYYQVYIIQNTGDANAVANYVKGSTVAQIDGEAVVKFTFGATCAASYEKSYGQYELSKSDASQTTGISINPYEAYLVAFYGTPTETPTEFCVIGNYSGSAARNKLDFDDSASCDKVGWQSYGSSPVPEPTSGLMMLIGLAGLALKRKVQG